MKNKVKFKFWPEVLLASVFLVVGFSMYFTSSKPTKPVNSTVMITNMEGNSGGTGSVYYSTSSYSLVLTNAHVCGLLEKNGGLVQTEYQSYRPTFLVKSPVSDLCMVTVLANLHSNEQLADDAPNVYSKVTVVGHPALNPTVVTQGHVSGRRILPILTGFEDCTEDDKTNDNAILCIFLMGHKPVIKLYESVLVTATIMPGSSGSGVYNNKNQLVGLVFAGSGELGYAWTVPYEQVVTFIEHLSVYESLHIPNKVDLTSLRGSNKKLSLS